MFARGAGRGKVDTWMYNEDDEDFTKGMKTCNYQIYRNTDVYTFFLYST